MQVSPLAPEEESDAEVRREDQNNINRFARLNARLHQVRQEQAQLRSEMEGLEDASTELMMIESGDHHKVLLLQGEAFFETSEEEATTFCEEAADVIQEKMNELAAEEEEITTQQAELKKILYGRFGKSINLEDS